MSEYQLADQYLFESSLKSEASTAVSKGKRVIQVIDTNQGSYQSGIINYDVASQLQGSKGFGSLQDAYITLPYIVSMKNIGSGAFGKINRYCTAMKAGVWNLIDTMSVELNGKTIITESDFKLYWNNLRAMTEWSTSDLNKHGADAFMYPDDWTSMSFQASETASGDGFVNNFTNPNAAPLFTPSETPFRENTGLISRINCNPLLTANIDASGNFSAGVNAFGWATQRSNVSVAMATQNAKGSFVLNPSPAAGSVLGVWHHMPKIYLTDLHPMFKELDLIGNPQLKLKIKVNAGYCDIAATATGLTLASTTMTSGNTVPVMLASADTNNALAGCNTASTTIRLAFGPLQNNITSLTQVGQYLPFTTSRLNIPFYDLVDPLPIISNPIKTVKYLDCYAQYFRGRAGTGADPSKQQNVQFNLQLSGSWKNIKYVCLIPYSETSSGHFTTANGVEQFQSPFDSAPWTCQPGSSIRSFQVQVGNDNVFSKTIDYDYEAWNDEFKKMGALNGGLTHEIANGLIDFQKWQTVQRIMVADCSRITNKDVPQSVVVSGVNACCQGTNLLALVIYERDLTYDRLTGEVHKFD
jgi:hypothetical protein